MTHKQRCLLWTKVHYKWTETKWKALLSPGESWLETVDATSCSGDGFVFDGMDVYQYLWNRHLAHLETLTLT